MTGLKVGLEQPVGDALELEWFEPELPRTAVPELGVPEAELPEVELPEVELPGPAIPELEVPEVELPGTAVPEPGVPRDEPPEVPNLGVPRAGEFDDEAPLLAAVLIAVIERRVPQPANARLTAKTTTAD